MARAPAGPLLSFDQTPTGARSPTIEDEPTGPKPKLWYHYIPVVLTVLLILSPHPSLLILLWHHYYKALNSRHLFLTHLLVTYTLTFITLSSLMVCVVRDPGPVGFDEAIAADQDGSRRSEDMSLAEALMAPSDSDDSDFNSPAKWCKACWAPKPARAHHCSHCGRCVLRMDHHCPWIANCVGHRTYTAFVHFIGSITLFAAYIAGISGSAVWWSFHHVAEVNEVVALHQLMLVGMGSIFSVVVGSFWLYHIYLITTNQTTLEHISPFLLLRHLPPLPPPASGRKLSNPPDQYELSYPQRALVKDAHGQIRMYDLGWRQNWAQVYGWGDHPRMWIMRIWFGGGCRGDGRRYPRNPKADDLLSRLAGELMSADKDA